MNMPDTKPASDEDASYRYSRAFGQLRADVESYLDGVITREQLTAGLAEAQATVAS